MKFIVGLLCCFFAFSGFSQNNLEQLTMDGHNYYFLSQLGNKNTIIFLHGGLNNPYFDQPSEKIKFDLLMEGNKTFSEQALQQGFNMIVPIMNDSLNWLEAPEYVFMSVKKMVSATVGNFEEIYISGFSDGGTGSYKIFYGNPDYFDGLIVFNGYPQHANFYQSVHYETVKKKKILFWSTFKDKVIPYEFLLTEYCKQKKTNPNTFFYLTEGEHSFGDYDQKDIAEVFEILTCKNQNQSTEPVQGFIKNDELIKCYAFRKKIVRKYSFGKETYEANLEQKRRYKNCCP